MLDYDRPLTDDEDPEDLPRRIEQWDAISEALDTNAFIARHTVDECRETLRDGTGRKLFPERFDRFYFQAGLLVDIVDDGDERRLARDRSRKHCEFKERWCKEHGRRYLVVPESADQVQIQSLLRTEPEHAAEDAPAPASPARRKPGRPRGVQRPTAPVA